MENSNKKENEWSKKDAFLEERARLLLGVLDDVREDYEAHPNFTFLKQGILKAFNSINSIREKLFEGETKTELETKETTGDEKEKENM